jgi:S-adenosylmethionine hydrolase
MKLPLVALLTDFGEDDYFVASLKAVILNLSPQARIVDICHAIPSFDIAAAGFVLFAAYKYFPQDTVFLVIVDPGVGGKRRILVVKTRKYYFIAPDNGVLSLALGGEAVQEIREITNPQFFLPHPSQTFEGRDKMAPAAAWLSRGARLEAFGPAVKNFRRKKIPGAEISGSKIQGRVLYADKFGNLITNIPAGAVESLAAEKSKERLSLFIAGKKYGGLRENYSAARKGEVFFIAGSLGLIEVSAREAPAADRLKLRKNQGITIAAGRGKR